jgi:hypothetical protein
MPGYYDWKIRNCGDGAIAKADSLRNTMEMVDGELHRLWDAGGGAFTPEINQVLAGVVADIDLAEDALERAKLKLAELFPGFPKGSVKHA